MIAKDYNRVQSIIQQLCDEYAYAVHQPHARNGGLIGLAAAAIALGPVSYARRPIRRRWRKRMSLISSSGATEISRDYSAARARMFYRSGCSCSLLRLRVHV